MYKTYFVRRQQDVKRLKASQSSHNYHEEKPDPVLWFPGGDAECGSNANSEYLSWLYTLYREAEA